MNLQGLTLEQLRQQREPSGQGARAARGGIFDEFLATDPRFQNVNPLVSRSLQNRFNTAEQSFLLQNQDPSATFFNFLQQGAEGSNPFASFLSPTEAVGRIAEIAGFGRLAPGTRSPGEDLLLDPLRPNRGAFNAALNTFLGGVTPTFAPAVQRSAQGIFDRFQGTDPSRSFLDFLGQRGGNIFGAVGSSGNPFSAFAR